MVMAMQMRLLHTTELRPVPNKQRQYIVLAVIIAGGCMVPYITSVCSAFRPAASTRRRKAGS